MIENQLEPGFSVLDCMLKIDYSKDWVYFVNSTIMQRFISFFLKAGEVKQKKQRSFVLREVDNPPTVASHCFRENLMAWVFSNGTDLDQAKLLKLTTLHDLIAGYAGDFTSYEPYLKDIDEQDTESKEEIFKKWVRLSKKTKKKFFKKKTAKEKEALEEIFAGVPEDIKDEAVELWEEYENLASPEARFIHQVDMLEIFLQALEYWEEDNDFLIEPWWHRMKEMIHQPKLLDFLQELEEKYHG